MKKYNTALILLVLMFSLPLGAEQIKFENAGFSIDALDEAPSENGVQSLVMMLPAKGGFAANVNVQIQPYTESLETYKTLSDGQIKQIGLTAISSTINDDAYFIEYSGKMQGRELHFYSKALMKDGFVYLVTATDLDSRWPENSEKLKSVVDSLILN